MPSQPSRRRRAARAVALLVLLATTVGQLAGPARAADRFRLDLPLDCYTGCFIQNYVDRDSGPAARDYTCGSLTYDGHKGTDIGLRHGRPIASGIAVLAPAAGMVLRGRDGIADLGEAGREAAKKAGVECGNGLIIDHGDGWQTQICHLRQGSVSVRPGDAVRAGQPVGEMGLSGDTQFPHVHLALRHKGELVDPFDGRPQAVACAAAAQPLWRQDALAALPYTATEILRAGFSDSRPDAQAVAEGRQAPHSADAHAPAMVFWADIKGLPAGARVAMALIGPDGKRLAWRVGKPADRHKARVFLAIGAKLKAAAWPAGPYRGEVQILVPAGNSNPAMTETRTLEISGR